jgi:adsorption protein B
VTLDVIQWYAGHLMAQYYHGLELLAIVVAVLILISSLDDLFIDVWYWVREVYRFFTVKRVYTPLTAEQLLVELVNVNIRACCFCFCRCRYGCA